MNTDTGEVSRHGPKRNAEIMAELEKALRDPDAPLPKELPLTEEEAGKVKLMSREKRREWGAKIYRAMKKKKKAELKVELGLPKGGE